MTFPTTPQFNSRPITSNISYTQSTAVNLKEQTRSLGGQRWEVALSYPPMRPETFAPIWAYLLSKQNGESFAITLPKLSKQFSTATGTVTIDGNYAAGSSTVGVSVSGTLKAGDYIKFSNHDKVYCIAGDRVSSGSLSIYPSLRTAVSSTHTIKYNNVPIQMKLKNPMLNPYSPTLDNVIQYSFDIVEAV